MRRRNLPFWKIEELKFSDGVKKESITILPLFVTGTDDKSRLVSAERKEQSLECHG